jgi:hypothetical protein
MDYGATKGVLVLGKLSSERRRNEQFLVKTVLADKSSMARICGIMVFWLK